MPNPTTINRTIYTDSTETESILGYPIWTGSLKRFINLVGYWIASGEKRRYFVCANPHSLMIAERDRLFKAALLDADLITPDGAGMIVASKLLGGAIGQRITGSGVFRELSCALNERKGARYFFLGSSEKNLTLLTEKVQKNFPNIEITGAYSPPFKPEFSIEDSRKMIEAVNQAHPKVLWVGMTAPKQEKWIYQYKDQLDVNFIGAVGAVFDFYVDNIKRSNPWFLEHGLEWLPRLIQDPKRLWKRNFISAPKFILRVLGQRFRQS